MSAPPVAKLSHARTPERMPPGEAAATTRQPSLRREIASHFALDVPLVIIVVIYCAVVLPQVPRWTANAPMLAAFTNDEPFITQQLDGMTVRPYGNPSNFLEVKNAGEIPAYWHDYRYYNLIYYGGTYLDAGFAPYWPLKALGAPAFPTAPIILRTISFLSGLVSLMLLYNFARRHAGRFAAIFAATALLFEFYFVFMATTIHPDMLQLALSLLALIVAARHARLGDWRSALTLGAVVGVIQGTKSGAPYVLPMVALAVLLGAWARPGATSLARRLATAGVRFAGVGVVALAAFVATTPYILFDPYYLTTTRGALGLLSGTSPLIPISFSSWYLEILRALGWPFLIALLAGIAWFFLRGAVRRSLDGALLLAFVLGAANVLWFTGVGRFWVVLYYLLAGLGLLSIFAGQLIARAAQALDARLAWRWPARAILALVILAVAFGNGRPAAIAQVVAGGLSSNRTPQFRLADWAQKNVPAKSNILFDDEAYFDPGRFPVQATNAGVIRYSDLFRKKPGYFVLTDYPPGSNWIMAKRQSQHFGKWSDDPYSVRLYQDLMDKSRTPYQVGHTPVAHIDLVKVIGLPGSDRAGQPSWFHGFDSLYGVLHSGYPGLQAKISGSHRLLLYRVDPAFYDQRSPFGTRDTAFTPISSPAEQGYSAASAFDGTGQVWLAKGQGASADGAYIGVDYGSTKQSVRTLRIKWVAEHWLPPVLRVERSDDGAHWTVVVTRKEVAPADQHDSPGLKRWTETIRIPATGAHRMWRIVAAGVRPTDYFGVDELALLN
jgi:hypothetical protein